VTLSTDDLDIGTGACIVPAGGGRTVFVLPWYGRALAGTTDNDYDGDIDHVPPGEDDVEYLLEALNSYFGTDVVPDELTGAYAGVRPLISTGDPKKSVDISRRAELYETSSGMLTITGGKLTTFRRMAALVVDRITDRDGRDAECRTDDIPLGMAARPEDSRPTRSSPTARPTSSPSAMGTRRARSSSSAISVPSWPSRSCRVVRICSRRSSSPPGTNRRGP
jgi:glycerol-3-phosphate dehydrogenase